MAAPYRYKQNKDKHMTDTPTQQKTPVLIGLSGKMAAGKDTVAVRLAPRLPHETSTATVSFAAGLKNEIAHLVQIMDQHDFDPDDAAKDIMAATGCTQDEATHIADIIFLDVLENGQEAVLNGEKTSRRREAFQYWGTNVRKASNPSYWIDLLAQEVDMIMTGGDSVVVTDVRFPDEAAYIRNNGGTLVRIEADIHVRNARLDARDRPGQPPAPPWYYHHMQSHASETALDDHCFDLIVRNDEDEVTEPVNLILEHVTKIMRNEVSGS